MPESRYIPLRAENPTVFPRAREKDFHLAGGRIKEVWRRMYPLVSYRRIKLFPTAPPDIETPSGVGTDGSWVDPLYLESVPENPQKKVLQPHSEVESPHRDAEKHNQYAPPVDLHAFIRIEVNEYLLKRWGIEEMFDIIAIFNTPELDERGIMISQGDRFLWQGQEYEVHQRKPDGWWMNTDLFLHMVTSCIRSRHGS